MGEGLQEKSSANLSDLQENPQDFQENLPKIEDFQVKDAIKDASDVSFPPSEKSGGAGVSEENVGIFATGIYPTKISE